MQFRMRLHVGMPWFGLRDYRPMSENARVEEATTQLRAHADALMLGAPGRVHVDRIHRLEEVRVLRACRAAVSDDEAAAIQQELLELKAHLHGIEIAIAPPKKSLKDRLKQALSGGADSAMVQGSTHQAREAAERSVASRGASGNTLMPPPKSLIDAAEAWLLATVAQDRIDVPIDVLVRPWQQARVAPQNHQDSP